MALCFLNSHLSPLRLLVPLRPTVLSTALCLLYSHLFPSKSLSALFSPLSPSTIFCTFYGHMSPLRHSILSMILCFLNSPQPSLLPSVP